MAGPIGVRDSESCWLTEEIGTYMRCWESPGDLPLVIDIKFISLLEIRVITKLSSRNESGRFEALKSDSTHHFFRNACTKSGSLRFSQFSVVD
jgi:hypothetical protein